MLLKSCSFIFRWLEFILDELCSSWIFQGYSLFSYQCSLLFSATPICYHIFKCLSTTFLFFFFSSFELMCCRFATALIFYQIYFALSRTFFIFFSEVISFFATARLFYQIVNRLSTTFFNFLFSNRQITCPDLFTVLFKKFCRRTFRSAAELILALFIFSVNTFSCFLINIFRSAYKHAKGIS